MPELPADLARALSTARHLELTADTFERRRHAQRALSVLLLAAQEAGWRGRDLAAVVGMQRSTVSMRILAARKRLDGARPGLELPAPTPEPEPEPTPAQMVRRLPADQREWLTLPEAGAAAGVSVSTIYLWLRAGLLPRTLRDSRSAFLYYRADLARIAEAPRRYNGGVDHDEVRRLIEQEVPAPAT